MQIANVNTSCIVMATVQSNLYFIFLNITITTSKCIMITLSYECDIIMFTKQLMEILFHFHGCYLFIQQTSFSACSIIPSVSSGEAGPGLEKLSSLSGGCLGPLMRCFLNPWFFYQSKLFWFLLTPHHYVLGQIIFSPMILIIKNGKLGS